MFSATPIYRFIRKSMLRPGLMVQARIWIFLDGRATGQMAFDIHFLGSLQPFCIESLALFVPTRNVGIA